MTWTWTFMRARQHQHSTGKPSGRRRCNRRWRSSCRIRVEGALDAARRTGETAEAAPRAAFNLGLLLEDQGEVAAACGAYYQAIDSGHPDEAPAAAFNLGVLLAEQGGMAGAREAFQQAIDSGHPEATEAARLGLRLPEST